ncbi:LytTR family DNA-binding domain-containing protein [Loktanella sp. IMCC34160]|uniref:LytTR family DNA-binding domain-containing protein n=1 Tax=Loktanella sp. IMCC34160 TaxID=2510646 RepID=UPI0013EC024E|nr:LytTR family DNA-binding domain-containing protein [Loktanella sp. IMCC34160]
MVIAWLAASIAATVTGPFDTYTSMPFWTRAVYWFGLIAISVALGYWVRRATDRAFGAEVGFARLEAIRILGFAALYAPIIYYVTDAMIGVNMAPSMVVLELFILIGAVCAIMSVLGYFILGIGAPEPPFRPRLADRLPEGVTGKIQRLSVDDHYVEVFMEDGAYHRLLMRFADAIAEMEGIPGHCTHRSHWVADAAVSGAFRRSGRDFLMLTDGTEIPVSRKYKPELVESGLFNLSAEPVDHPETGGEKGTAKARGPVMTATAGE